MKKKLEEIQQDVKAKDTWQQKSNWWGDYAEGIIQIDLYNLIQIVRCQMCFEIPFERLTLWHRCVEKDLATSGAQASCGTHVNAGRQFMARSISMWNLNWNDSIACAWQKKETHPVSSSMPRARIKGFTKSLNWSWKCSNWRMRSLSWRRACRFARNRCLVSMAEQAWKGSFFVCSQQKLTLSKAIHHTSIISFQKRFTAQLFCVLQGSSWQRRSRRVWTAFFSATPYGKKSSKRSFGYWRRTSYSLPSTTKVLKIVNFFVKDCESYIHAGFKSIGW